MGQSPTHIRSTCAGCARVAGDDEGSLDGDDFNDEFQIKNTRDQQNVFAPSVI